MIQLSLDFETYSRVNLKVCGVSVYAESPSTEVICAGYSIDGAPPELWLPGQPLPDFAINPERYYISAWNSFFEMCIIKYVLKDWKLSDISHWSDTSARARALALPRPLGQCGQVLKIPRDKAKDLRGSALIDALCKPNDEGVRNQDPELLVMLYEYCLKDVIAEQTIAKRLPQLTPSERELWELDQKINFLGVPVDIPSVDKSLSTLDVVIDNLKDKVVAISGGALKDLSKRNDLFNYFEAEGFPLTNLTKGYLTRVLKIHRVPDHLRLLIEMRLQLSKTSTTKYKKLKKVTNTDGRARGMLMFMGANTGRWASTGVNFQNLPRPTIEDTDSCVDLINAGNIENLMQVFPDTMSALSSCIRSMIKATPGKKLIVADYSSIEARILAGISGQHDVIKVFRTTGKVYEHAASKIFNKKIEAITKEERFIGKLATLSMGYQGGVAAFNRIANDFDVEFSDKEAEAIKIDWRKSNKKIVDYWYEIEKAAVRAIKYPSVTTRVRIISFKKVKNVLVLKLPSGRLLTYRAPKIVCGKFGNDQMAFMGIDATTKQWVQKNAYGGYLVENLTQAIARDLMAVAMIGLEKAGYEIILTVHDEIICEVPKDFGSVDEFVEIMTAVPKWAKGLPITAEGFECQRFRKQ